VPEAHGYAVDIRPAARRALRQLDAPARRAVTKVIDELAADPHPSGAVPLQGHRPYLRVRSGDYRVIYAVDDRARVVAVIGHRREIYRNLNL
jgi:mRNA interferase RelE/StbE